MSLGKQHFNVAASGNNHKLKMVAQVWQGLEPARAQPETRLDLQSKLEKLF